MSNTLNKIRLSGLIEESIVDGPGMRMVIFTQGCMKRCYLCHNPETQPLHLGYDESLDEIVEKWRKNPLLQGITISGGEPFLQPKACLYLTKKAIEDGLDVLFYSGYYYEELFASKNQDIKDILLTAHYLIDGPFEHKLKSLNLLFRGSSNQRFINLRQSHIQGNVVLYEKEKSHGSRIR